MEKNRPLARMRAFVAGRVQGVLFRMFVLREAKALGLCGTVRNLLDGRVEVTAEGDRERLEKLVALLGKGPPRAAVSEVAVEWETFEREFDSFDILYG